MKKIIFLLLISFAARSQEVNIRVSGGINENKVFATNLGASIVYHNVMAEANLITVGYSGQLEPVLIGGRIGYKILYFTPLFGRYYAYISSDKKVLNYWCNLYGIRAEKEIVNGNGVFMEWDYCKQNLFMLGLKIKL